MTDEVSVPAQRHGERDVAIRELRNAGKVLAELAAVGAVGRVTSGGRLVGWLVPASEAERQVEELVAEGRMTRATRPGGLAGRRPRPRRTDTPLLSATLELMRDEERS